MEQIVSRMNKIINDITYNEVINSLAKQKGFEISDGGFHIKTLYENEFRKSNFSEDELINILKERKEQLIKFVLSEDNQSDDDFTGEYQEGEEQDDDINDEEFVENDVPKYFLISSLIKFNFLRKGDLYGLEEYFKKTKIPHAKQYVKELSEIYNKL
jgi:hypothetical protein